MKEAIVKSGPEVEIVDSPVPEPNDDQLLIKVVVSGSNPKDWKLPEWLNMPGNTGDDIAGEVVKVGKNVTEFKQGDRVFAFHEMTKPGGSFAEYALAWQHTTAHLPANTSFEEGAAVPLAALTAAVGLYRHLNLPQPWTPATDETPLVIYGAASAVGIYTVQLAKLAGISPLICIAGKSIAHVESFLDTKKGDVIIDYREGDEAIVEGIKKAANGRKLLHAYDAVSEHGSWENLSKALSPGATITTVLPTKHEEVIPESIKISRTMVGSVHEEDKDLGFVYMRYFARGLQQGFFKPQPQTVVPGGLNGVKEGLSNLKEGKANAVKFVFRIAETS
ncbi:chaperonin 10-like protein [Coniella lustricola]|uniref:Chaperonin 10-like protein n=1 Tax=Coniella lustricola TaxID=2025994 RepID=A0A2T2ZW94_9PEZI|nr:chaperonin 10-like protein [Coniella lustricola]